MDSLGSAQHRAYGLDSLSLRVILRPNGLELIQVMRAQDGPVSCEVVKVVHDDSHKEVDDLQEEDQGLPTRKAGDAGAWGGGRHPWVGGCRLSLPMALVPHFTHRAVPISSLAQAKPNPSASLEAIPSQPAIAPERCSALVCTLTWGPLAASAFSVQSWGKSL